MAKLIAGFQGWAMGVGEKERERECREVHPLINRPINTPSDSEFPVNFTVTTHDALVGIALPCTLYTVQPYKQVGLYRRRYESFRSSKPKLHLKNEEINKIWRKTIFNMAD